MAALEVAAKITPEIMARIEKIVQTAPEVNHPFLLHFPEQTHNPE